MREYVYLLIFMHSILRTQCGGESHWVSWTWFCTYHHAENISSGKILCRERLIQTVFIPTPAEPIILPPPQTWPFLPWVSHARESSIRQNSLLYVIVLSPFFLQNLRGFTEAGQGSECHLLLEKTSASCCQFFIAVLPLFRSSSSVQVERITVIFFVNFFQGFIIRAGGENHRHLLHRQFPP